MSCDVQAMKPHTFRALVREGSIDQPTGGACPGYAQANVAILPREHAYDFLVFSTRNPKPCPLVDVTDPGDPGPPWAAPRADLRTDVPRYRIYRDGRLDAEVTDVTGLWQDDLVSFLLGCSYTFERALLAASIPVRHIELGTAVPMYVTSIATRPAGIFSGPMVVSMRPLPAHLVPAAVVVSGRYGRAHGAPVHIGDPSVIGISDLDRPDFGDPPVVNPGEVPVFWPCGVTSQMAIMEARLPLAITHAPGRMFITDRLDEDLAGY